MKFLCVPCDEPMKLIKTTPPDRGSVSLVYSCPACAYEFAMLTNPFETQLVGSLGVKVGPAGSDERAAAGDAAGGSKCPFTAMLGGTGAAVEAVSQRGTEGAVTAGDGATAGSATTEAATPAWTEAARRRLESIPEFVRPMARIGIEKFARDRGYAEIDERVLDEARDHFGM